MSLPALTLTDAEKIYTIESIVQGKSLFNTAKSLGIPWSTILNFLNKDPLFKKEIKQSREIWVDNLVCSLIGITKDATTMAEVSAAKVESENIKWAASKFVPEIFGDNLNVNVSHSLDLSSILLAAENRILPIMQRKTDAYDGSGEAIVDIDVVRDACKQGESIDRECLKDRECLNDTKNGGDSIPDELKDMI